jgi:hypothetical protein
MLALTNQRRTGRQRLSLAKRYDQVVDKGSPGRWLAKSEARLGLGAKASISSSIVQDWSSSRPGEALPQALRAYFGTLRKCADAQVSHLNNSRSPRSRYSNPIDHCDRNPNRGHGPTKLRTIGRFAAALGALILASFGQTLTPAELVLPLVVIGPAPASRRLP